MDSRSIPTWRRSRRPRGWRPRRASRLVPPLLFVGVAALVGAAVFDAVRAKGGKDAARPFAAVTEELRTAGARGLLVYTRRDCALRARTLPTLALVRLQQPPGRRRIRCDFSMSRRGRHVGAADWRWAPGRAEWARCVEGYTDVIRPPFDVRRSFEGCAPAWRSDGRLTVARSARYVEVRSRCPEPPCEAVLLARRQLELAAARHPMMPDSLEWLRGADVVDAVWLTEERLVALVEARLTGSLAAQEPLQVVALFDAGALSGTFVSFEPVERLVADPLGRYVGVEPGRLIRTDGTDVDFPERLPRVTALDFSPDGRWVAAATAASVYLLPLAGLEAYDDTAREPDVVRLPIRVRDLAWR